MSGYWLALLLAFVVLLTIVQLLRTRRLREKYAAAWLAVAVVVVVLSLFPALLARLARLVGVTLPANLLFALGGAMLLVVAIQYSVEISALEAETRTLAEELALTTHLVRELSARLDSAPGPMPSGSDATASGIAPAPPGDRDPSDDA